MKRCIVAMVNVTTMSSCGLMNLAVRCGYNQHRVISRPTFWIRNKVYLVVECVVKELKSLAMFAASVSNLD